MLSSSLSPFPIVLLRVARSLVSTASSVICKTRPAATAARFASFPAGGFHHQQSSSSSSLLRASPPPLFTLPRRSMFIRSQDTPNPASLMFIPGVPVLDKNVTMSFDTMKDAQISPLAKRLLRVDGVKSVMLGQEIITVTKTDDAAWPSLKPDIFATIMDFFSSGHAVLDASSSTGSQATDTTILPEDDEVVASIKELLETRIRPVVQDDGGDIHYVGFVEGIVKLKMVGSCSSCPSSTATLKGGVENLLMHYIPEVMGVEAVKTAEDDLSDKELAEVDKRVSK